MPSYPFRTDEQENHKRVGFYLKGKESSRMVSDSAASEIPMHASSYSQPIPTGSVAGGPVENINLSQQYPSMATTFQDRTFDSSKTWSGKLERQLTNLHGGQPQPEAQPEKKTKKPEGENNLPVDRYFDDLEGPELDTLRVCIFLFFV